MVETREQLQAATSRTDWSESLGLKVPIMSRQLNSIPDSIDVAREFSNQGHLLTGWGSRSLAWRIFLGLLQVRDGLDGEAVKVNWVKQMRAMRKKWADLEKSMSLIAIASANKKFNPLAPPKASQDEKSVAEKEMKDLIKQDVSRTLQEFPYFRKIETKDLLTQILYLWGRENPDYGYKQGMNEILAMVVIVFDTERLVASQQPPTDWAQLSDQQIANDHLQEYLFDAESSKADIYACFDRILQLGIKHLYMDTKDITELKKSRMRKKEAAQQQRSDLFQFSQSQEQEQKQFRKELEQAYEREKQKSVISKRCSRIYEDHLKSLEPRLHKHLVDNEVVPELHLTRWLRCVMSREFCIETTLKMWDFIFAGMEDQMIEDILAEQDDTDDNVVLLKEASQDPFINLECLSVAMVSLIKADLLESDFSMCLGLLMSYKEPEDPSTVLKQANKVRKRLVNGETYQRVPSPDLTVQQDSDDDDVDPYSNNDFQPEEAKKSKPQPPAYTFAGPTQKKAKAPPVEQKRQAQGTFNPLAGQQNYNQISTSASLRKAGGQSYLRLQETAQALAPALNTAGEAASKAKATIAQNVLNPLGNFMGKAKTQMQASYNQAYVQNQNKGKSGGRNGLGGDDEAEFMPMTSASSSKSSQSQSKMQSRQEINNSSSDGGNNLSKLLAPNYKQQMNQPASNSNEPNNQKLQDQNKELTKILKTTTVKLMVLQNSLTSVQTQLNESQNENDDLDTSIAQVHALIENLRTGLEQNTN